MNDKSTEPARTAIEFLNASKPPPNADMAAMRAWIDGFGRATPATPDVSIVSMTIAGVPVIRCSPRYSAQGAVVYLHGGGFSAGSFHSHGPMTAALAQLAAMPIYFVEYSLAPEHVFPRALDEVVAVIETLMTRYGPGVTVAGDSAGGNLALSSSLRLRDRHLSLPAAIACVSPWCDLELTGPSLETHAELDPMLHIDVLRTLAELYGGDPSNPYVSPLHGDLAGLPPLLVQVGSREIVLDDARRFAARAAAASVEVTLREWPEMIHAWHLFGMLPEAHAALEEMACFLRVRSAAAAAAAA